MSFLTFQIFIGLLITAARATKAKLCLTLFVHRQYSTRYVKYREIIANNLGKPLCRRRQLPGRRHRSHIPLARPE